MLGFRSGFSAKYLNLCEVNRNDYNHHVWWKLFFQLFIFSFAVIGPWLWIKSRTQIPKNQFFLKIRHEIPGSRFSPVALDLKTKISLETSNIFSGHFVDANSNRVTVFAAEWQPGQGDLGSLGHTPEKCWVGTGFRIVPFDGPSQLPILVGGRPILFQCRVLKHSDLAFPEITVWVACIDGQWDNIPYEPPQQQIQNPYDFRDQFLTLLSSYTNRWKFFCERLFFRYDPAARKQFVRLSTPLDPEWQLKLVELADFANRWLYLE